MDLNQVGNYLGAIAQQLETLNRTLIGMQSMLPGRSSEQQQMEMNAHVAATHEQAAQQQPQQTPPTAPTQTAPAPQTAGPVPSVDDLKAAFKAMNDKYGPDARRMLKAEWNAGGPTMVKKELRSEVLAWMQAKLEDGGAAAAGAPPVPQQTTPQQGTLLPPQQGIGAPAPGQGMAPPPGPQAGPQPQFQAPQMSAPQADNLSLLREKARGYFDGPQTAHFMSLMLQGNNLTSEQVLSDMDEANLAHFIQLAEGAMVEQKVLS